MCVTSEMFTASRGLARSWSRLLYTYAPTNIGMAYCDPVVHIWHAFMVLRQPCGSIGFACKSVQHFTSTNAGSTDSCAQLLRSRTHLHTDVCYRLAAFCSPDICMVVASNDIGLSFTIVTQLRDIASGDPCTARQFSSAGLLPQSSVHMPTNLWWHARPIYMHTDTLWRTKINLKMPSQLHLRSRESSGACVQRKDGIMHFGVLGSAHECQDERPYVTCCNVTASAPSYRPIQVLRRCAGKAFYWPTSLPITFRNCLFRTAQLCEASTRLPIASFLVSGVDLQRSLTAGCAVLSKWFH